MTNFLCCLETLYTAVHLSYLKNVSVALYILFSSIEHHSVYTKIDGLQKNSLILNSFLWAAAPVFEQRDNLQHCFFVK